MSFSHLLLAEVSRLRYRSRALLGALAMLLLSLVGPPMWMRNTAPVSPAEYEEAAAAYEASLPDCGNCTVETYLRESWDFSDVVHIGIAPWMLILAVLVLMLVMVYVGSDFSSGVITTQLTFTPNRMRLLVGRVLVSGLLGAILMGIAVLASSALSIVWFVALNGYASLPVGSGLLGVMGASLLLGLIVGILGALLVFLFHGAAVAMSLVAAILVGTTLFEILAIDSTLPPHWLYHLIPTRHAESLVVGMSRRSYDQYPLGSTTALTPEESLLFFVGLIVLGAVLAAVVFHRRDIKN